MKKVCLKIGMLFFLCKTDSSKFKVPGFAEGIPSGKVQSDKRMASLTLQKICCLLRMGKGMLSFMFREVGSRSWQRAKGGEKGRSVQSQLARKKIRKKDSIPVLKKVW